MTFEIRKSAWIAIVSAAALLMVAAAPTAALGQGKGPGVKALVTAYSTLGLQNNEFGWVGNAIIALGGQTPVAATYFCPLSIPNFKPGGEMYGTEVCTYTLPDGTYTVLNRFTALPDSAPNLYVMHTISTIKQGTGRYADASGQLIERAQFIFDPNFPVPAPALGSSQGMIYGIQ